MGSSPGPMALLGTARGLCQATQEHMGRGGVLFVKHILCALSISPSWFCMVGTVLILQLKKLRLQEALTHFPK